MEVSISFRIFANKIVSWQLKDFSYKGFRGKSHVKPKTKGTPITIDEMLTKFFDNLPENAKLLLSDDYKTIASKNDLVESE